MGHFAEAVYSIFLGLCAIQYTEFFGRIDQKKFSRIRPNCKNYFYITNIVLEYPSKFINYVMEMCFKRQLFFSAFSKEKYAIVRLMSICPSVRPSVRSQDEMSVTR